MKKSNVEFLIDRTKFTGFGDKEFEIKANIKNNLPAFEIAHEHAFLEEHNGALIKEPTDAKLYYKKSSQENYFYNKYDLTLNKGAENEMKQTFYIDKPTKLTRKVEGAEDKIEWIDSTITLKEAFNMMKGRSVLKEFVSKEGNKYANWLTLDFKNTDANGNYKIKKRPEYDLEGKLASSLPIEGFDIPETRKEIMESIERGNRQAVTIVDDGVKHKQFIEAQPQFEGYARHGITKPVATQGESNDQSSKESQKEGQKEEQKQDENRQSQGRSHKRSQGIPG